ncbi:hypothetical protein ACHAWX_001999 [Stephanocyclus meneghinianus]
MGTSKPPIKKAPAKKSSKSKPTSTKLKANANLSSSSLQETTHIRIPSNLPLCIIDNGGWEVKYGLFPTSIADGQVDTVQPSKMPNATARPPHQLTLLTGDEILRMKNLGQLSFQHPLERGMMVDGYTQWMVWSRVLNLLGVTVLPTNLAVANAKLGGGKRPSLPSKTITTSNNLTFMLLEPPFVPSVISEGIDRILFRELGVGRVVKLLGACMAAVRYLEEGRRFTKEETKKDEGDDIVINAAATVVSSADDMKQDHNSRETWIDDGTRCCCVVDSGYSFTHVVPTQSGAAVESAIRRLDIGGKMLTNLLKEAVTYRQWNMMDEYHIVNDAKEQLCFVSDRFDEEMKYARTTRRGLRWFDREFLLPDFVNTFKGSVQLPMPLQRMRELEEEKKQQLVREKKELDRSESRDGIPDNIPSCEEDFNQENESDESKEEKRKRRKSKRGDDVATEDDDQDDEDDSNDESDEETEQQRLQRLKQMRELERKRREAESRERQALALSVERFAIPEVLFRPSDIGLDCGGIADAIVESINACDATLRAAMYHNVLLVGGNAKIPGFKDRVEVELRRLAPVNYVVRVFLPDDPVAYAWEGAKQFSRQPGFQERFGIDRIGWEAMKKAGKDQKQIWGDRIHNNLNNS